ncbi:diphthamide synthesis protein [Nanoarchaeota archaeon]
MEYDLELERAVKEVKKVNAKKVCIQLPEGLKPKAKEIVDEITSKTGADVQIWMGSCFGACDFPFYLDKYGFDLLIAWGHSTFVKPKERFK